MQLSAQQLNEFKTNGFVVIPNFFDATEVKAIQAEIERLKRIGKLRNVATEGDGKTVSANQKNLQLCPMYKDSTLFRALPFVPKVKSAITALIGEPVILHLDQVFLKPGGDGMGTSWHQDNAYFQIEDPMKGTAMWIAAHDATIANGTMHLIPGVFSQKLEHTRDPLSDHHIRCFPDESKEVPAVLKAGGVVFFCYGTPHCTKGNKTDKERAGVAFHFLHEAVAMKTSYAKTMTDENREYNPYVNGPKFDGGVKQYGVKIDDAWDAEVEKAMAEV